MRRFAFAYLHTLDLIFYQFCAFSAMSTLLDTFCSHFVIHLHLWLLAYRWMLHVTYVDKFHIFLHVLHPNNPYIFAISQYH